MNAHAPAIENVKRAIRRWQAAMDTIGIHFEPWERLRHSSADQVREHIYEAMGEMGAVWFMAKRMWMKTASYKEETK